MQFYVLLLFTPVTHLVAYNVLIYNPQVGHSHVTFWGNVADVLARAKHNVTVYLPAYNEDVNSTGVKLAAAILRPRHIELSLNLTELASDFWLKDALDVKQMQKMTRFMGENQNLFCHNQLADGKLMERLKAGNYDVAISEVMSSCGFAIFQKIGIRTHISGFATNLMEMATTPFELENNPSYVPAAMSELSDVMSFLERAFNFGALVVSRFFMELFVYSRLFYEKAVPGFNLKETIAHSDYILVNSDEYMEFTRPLDPRVVYLGGIGVRDPQPLKKEYKTALDETQGPVVLVAFGSVVQSSSMPPELKAAFVEMFSRLPQVLFIWKYEGNDDAAGNLTNVLKRGWIPQNDLLGHPRVRAVISHGGLNSIIESAHAGVPTVCIPLFGDQMRNAKMIEKRGTALVLNKKRLTSEALTEAVRTVLFDHRYLSAAQRLRDFLRKKSVTMQERVVKYVERSVKSTHTKLSKWTQPRVPSLFAYYFLDFTVPVLLLSTAVLSSLITA